MPAPVAALAAIAAFSGRLLSALLLLMGSVADEGDDPHARKVYLEEVDPGDREGTVEVGE